MATWNPDDRYSHNPEKDVLNGQWANKNDYPQSASGFHSPGIGKSRSKRKATCIALLLLFVVIVVGLAIAIPMAVKNNKSNNASGSAGGSNDSNPLSTLSIACSATRFPVVCYDSLGSFVNSSGSVTPEDLVKYAITVASQGVQKELSEVEALVANTTGPASEDADIQAVADDCVSFLQDATDSLNETVDEYRNFSSSNAVKVLVDVQTWVSAALTYQQTCLDEINDLDLGPTNGSLGEFIQQGNYAAKLLSNVLSLLVALKNVTTSVPPLPGNRRLLSDDDHGPSIDVEELRSRFLQTSNPTPNVTVASDGSGDFSKIQDAVDQAPVLRSGSCEQYVIYIKAGTYSERVLVPKSADNIMFIGDGISKTIIFGSLRVIGSNISASFSKLSLAGYSTKR